MYSIFTYLFYLFIIHFLFLIQFLEICTKLIRIFKTFFNAAFIFPLRIVTIICVYDINYDIKYT